MPAELLTPPTTARPSRRNPEASRRRILAAATETFAALGLDGARVDDIAERAGINKRMLYHYFGNKDDLFGAVLDALYEQICRESSALDLETGSPRQAVDRLVEFVIDFYLGNPKAITLLNAENLHLGRHLKKSELIRSIHLPFEEMLDALLARGVKTGDFRKGISGARLYISIVGLIYYYLSNSHSLSVFFDRDLLAPKELEDWKAHIHEMVTRFVAADPQGGKKND